MSSLKSQEGCGKWLTTRGITNPKKQVSFTASPCNTRPAVTPIIQDKLCHMKQSKMSDFFGSRKQHNSVTPSSEVPVVAFTVKRGISVALNKYELFGNKSEGENNDDCKSFVNSQTTFKTTNYPEPAKILDPSKKFKKAEDEEPKTSQQDSPDEGHDAAHSDTADTSSTSQLYATIDEALGPFTQWFQEKVDEVRRLRETKKELELAKELALSPEPYDTYSSRKSQQDSPDEGDATSIHYNTSSTSQLHTTTTDTFPFTQWLQEELDEFHRREMKKEDGQSSEVKENLETFLKRLETQNQ